MEKFHPHSMQGRRKTAQMWRLFVDVRTYVVVWIVDVDELSGEISLRMGI